MENQVRDFCCPGCLAVCQTITAAGLGAYYRQRRTPAGRADPGVLPEQLRQLELYDHPRLQQGFVRNDGERRQASLILEEIRCPACLWLNEQHLRALDGVLAVDMDYTSQRVTVQWDPQRIRLSEILAAIAAIGYVAHPYDPSHRDRLLADRKHRDLQRILFAGLVGMPVMEFTLATYFLGEFATGRLELWEVIGRWTTLIASLAVLLYSAQDFFIGAWRDLQQRRPGMDLPIVLGLSTAWLGSLVVALGGPGDFYVDAVTMFVFLVLLARAYEMRARVLAADALDRLARVIPQTARRLTPGGEEEQVLAVDLCPGDHIRVRPGEVIPADGILHQGQTAVDQSMLTGESMPVARQEGDRLAAGTCNREQPVVLAVTQVGDQSTAGQLRQLLDLARASRPRAALLAERVAAWFVPAVLLVATLTAGLWLWLDPERALPSVIAVLIVTCPCALALATPMAIAVASGRFAAAGILPLRLQALEALAAADLVVFDKTGTLTLGQLEVVEVLPGELGRERALALARALEAHSEHPVARALLALDAAPPAAVAALRVHPARGVEGWIDGRRWRIGRRDFAWPAGSGHPDPGLPLTPLGSPEWLQAEIARRQRQGMGVVVLADDHGPQALFVLRDQLRPGAIGLVAALRATGLGEVTILSGDATANVAALARELDINDYRGDQDPADKLAWIQARQAAGRRVLMVGDGINDAPTLAAAGVSFSFGEATDLAQVSSDFILLGRDLRALPAARRLAVATRRVIRQNLSWALAYNLLAIPGAALGLVPPWAAALGMSASSLLVVANALRLRRLGEAATPPVSPDGAAAGRPLRPTA